MEFALKRQLSVALQADEPGRLAALTHLVSDRGFNIEALCVVDNMDQGVVRVLVDQPGPCKDMLLAEKFSIVEAEVLAIKLTDRKGRLATVTKALAAARINIDYAYSTVDHREAHTLLVMKVSDARLAESILHGLAES